MVLHPKALHLKVLLRRLLLWRTSDVPGPHLELVHLNSLRNHLPVDELLLLHVHAVLASLKVNLLLQLHLLMMLRLLLHLLELRVALHLSLVLHLNTRLAQLVLTHLLLMLLA